ncbi:MAG: monofunctional biosynthetic peptidoglycan transglycosylase [Pseudomonadota bacterium]
MNHKRPRTPPSLEPTTNRGAVAPNLFVAPRRRAQKPGLADAPGAPPRRRGPILPLLLWTVLAAVALLVLTILALRFVPPPTTAFMLQSPTKPVRYEWVSAKYIADSARHAVVASEDQKFFEHRGFDFEAIGDALEENRSGTRRRGASTISQQTAKNLFLWQGGGYFRKGLEAVLTVLLETLWSKDRILEVYLNIAEFGPGIYGVEAAAHAFFDKPAARLSAAESARLAAVLPSPRRWSARNPGPYVRQRSAWILRQMGYVRTGDVDGEEAADPMPARDPALDDWETLPQGDADTTLETAPLDDAAAQELQPIPVEPEPAPPAGAEPVPAAPDSTGLPEAP